MSGRRERWQVALLGPPPLSRQAAAHLASTAGDAALAVSLAGSLFFQVSVEAARPAIVLYLALTMAPFAVVAPLIGPALDRLAGGYRMLCALSCAARAAIALVLAGHLERLFLYPEVFCLLVLGKAYSIGKSALVPRLVSDEGQLVGANARLARLSAIAAMGAGGLAAALLGALGGPWVVRLAAALWAGAAVLALRIPKPQRRATRPNALEWAELHRSALVDAAGAMAVLRAAVGFLTFLLAFELKRSGTATWVFGAVLVATGVGSFLGTAVAPLLRRRWSERSMLAASLAAPLLPLAAGALEPGPPTAAAVAASIGLAASVGRQSFDALVQRLAPDADRGRAFAGFETRFQLAWVAGALVPVLARPPLPVAFAGLGAVIAVVAAMLAGRRGRAAASPADEVEALLAAAERLTPTHPREAVDVVRAALAVAGVAPPAAVAQAEPGTAAALAAVDAARAALPGGDQRDAPDGEDAETVHPSPRRASSRRSSSTSSSDR